MENFNFFGKECQKEKDRQTDKERQAERQIETERKRERQRDKEKERENERIFFLCFLSDYYLVQNVRGFKLFLMFHKNMIALLGKDDNLNINCMLILSLELYNVIYAL